MHNQRDDRFSARFVWGEKVFSYRKLLFFDACRTQEKLKIGQKSTHPFTFLVHNASAVRFKQCRTRISRVWSKQCIVSPVCTPEEKDFKHFIQKVVCVESDFMFMALRGILFINALLRPGRGKQQNLIPKPLDCILQTNRSLYPFAINHQIYYVWVHILWFNVVVSYTSLENHYRIRKYTGVRLSYFPEGYDNYNATKKNVYVVTRQGTNTNASRDSSNLNKNLENEMEKTSIDAFFLSVFDFLFVVHVFKGIRSSIKFMRNKHVCELSFLMHNTQKKFFFYFVKNLESTKRVVGDEEAKSRKKNEMNVKCV